MSKSRLPWALGALALFAITRGRVIEVQARYYQRLVYLDLARRAREFWLSRGPMPQFP